MGEGAPTIYKHEQTQFSLEEFEKRFNNFHLVFMIDEPEYEYMSKVKGFLLQSKYSDRFTEIKERFKKMEKKEVNKENRRDIIKEYMSDFYNMYLELRKDKRFSNKNLGLIYW